MPSLRLKMEVVEVAVLLLPVAQLALVDQHHVFQHPQRHEAVGLGLVFNEDVQQDLPLLAALRRSHRGLQDEVGFEMAPIALDEATRLPPEGGPDPAV